MKRDKEFPLDMQQARNMADLLARVNFVLASLKIKARVSSGYRPSALNKSIGGAKLSTHTVCAGIDLYDEFGDIAKLLKSRLDVLEFAGLYMEEPTKTIGWTHLDTKKRKTIIFNP